MNDVLGVLSYFLDLRFVSAVFAGSVAGLFVGAIPGLSVSMATALLVSVTYSWSTGTALGMIMGVYVVGVFSGAISAILINIPGAPSSVVTTIDGYPLALKGESYKALKYATVYSFTGSVFGLLALWVLARPITALALKFTPMDYFLLALFGLAAVGSLTARDFSKGLVSAVFGLIASMVGIDSVMGTPRLTFGIYDLAAGIGTVPALVGLFGFSEVLTVIAEGAVDGEVSKIARAAVKTGDILKHWVTSLYSCVIGTLVGALPGAGGPVASFLAYGAARRVIKKPSAPFGEGAVEGIVASESANNACIGGALIPMLTLAVPGDAVTAVILSVFYIHGLRPGPMFLKTSPQMFQMILAGGFAGSVFLLVLGLLAGPRISKIIAVPKRLLIPAVMVLCVIGAFAGNSRMFDVALMFVFGGAGFLMRRRGYPVAPMTLALVLGRMMDSEFRRAVSLAVSEDALLPAMFGRPITLILTALTLLVIFSNVPGVKRLFAGGHRA
jgi:putative tricarboxylic transport membrane protein